MKRALIIAGAVIALTAFLGVSGYAFANAPKKGEMTGVIVAARNGALEATGQPGAIGSIKIARVKVPSPSWIVVHLDDKGMPGARIGISRVARGDNRDVAVKLDNVKLTDKLIVAVHADRGIRGKFEFDKARFEASPDKPYFVDGMELAASVGVATSAGAAGGGEVMK